MPSIFLPVKPKALHFDAIRAMHLLKDQADWVGLRYLEETTQVRNLRNGKSENQEIEFDRGVQIEVLVNGHRGYSSTADLSPQGLQLALNLAKKNTQVSSSKAVFKQSEDLRPNVKGQFQTSNRSTIDSLSLASIMDFLLETNKAMQISPEIISAISELRFVQMQQHWVTSSGADVAQAFDLWSSNFMAIAQRGSEIQRRSLNGLVARCFQGDAEGLNESQTILGCEQTAKEAIQLLSADECPNKTCDLILMPDQMLLQIHESIGHPLELDRILGDERNYAGWSFVQPDDFGRLQFGSELMNVTFDPTIQNEFASYQFDDCGNEAKKEFLIEKGLLKRGLGSLESQARSGIPGVANARSSSWNRAPIDRMANINIEPGSSSLSEMIKQTEDGIIMYANRSWSIDDYRNKFQFGCEFAQLIKDGKLGSVVKNPNYRGSTVKFWQGLKAVGNLNEFEVFGSPWCGKGEPNQVIRVGHASPPCLFSQVEVFGGGS